MSLVEQIHAIEERFSKAGVRSGVPREDDERFIFPTGWAGVDAALGDGLAVAALHEWFGIEESDEAIPARRDHAPRRSHGAWTPPLAPLVHLVKQAVSGSEFSGQVVWIGRRCFPYGGVLIGENDDRPLRNRSIFVMADRADDRLWAIDLTLRCHAVGVVAADGSGFDMAATRRIQLVAKAHHTTALLVRPPWEMREPSAAQTRWLVRWDATHDQYRDRYGAVGATERSRRAGTTLRDEATKGEDESTVLNPRWSVELLRCKGGQPEYHPRVWALEWDRGQGAVRLSTAVAGTTGRAGTSTPMRRLRQA